MPAEDHPFVVFGLREMLGKRLDFKVVAEDTNPHLLLDKLAHIECDVLITDFSKSCDDAPDGLALLHSIRVRFPNVRIVVLTMLDNPGLLGSMRKAGELSLLNKRDGLQELPNAIIAPFQRREQVSASVRESLARLGTGNPEAIAIGKLSPREIEVLRLYVGGMTTSDIVRHQNRSINTVSTQKHSAKRKIGVKNDAIGQGLKA
ncbi:response regulator transcription factor [Cupriavidus pauculus]|nr:response regulator transcription factor [Cupriavidus pauculus]